MAIVTIKDHWAFCSWRVLNLDGFFSVFFWSMLELLRSVKGLRMFLLASVHLVHAMEMNHFQEPHKLKESTPHQHQHPIHIQAKPKGCSCKWGTSKWQMISTSWKHVTIATRITSETELDHRCVGKDVAWGQPLAIRSATQTMKTKQKHSKNDHQTTSFNYAHTTASAH